MPVEIGLRADKRGPVTLWQLAGLPEGILGAVTDRRGGRSSGSYSELNLGDHVGDDPAAVLANRNLLAAALGGRPVAVPDQQHKATVAVIDSSNAGAGFASDAAAKRLLPATDGLVTADPSLVLGVMVADCAPVVLVDPVRRVLGVAHCGRGGAVLGVVPAVIARLTGEFGSRPADLVVGVGPHIQPGSYEIGGSALANAEAAFPSSAGVLRSGLPGHAGFDLAAAIRHQLVEAGVPESSSHFATVNTADDPERFFSDRTVRPCGRFMLVASLSD